MASYLSLVEASNVHHLAPSAFMTSVGLWPSSAILEYWSWTKKM
eukprot:CAMPEP_0113975806 /NCGR_PEP_ID=MMETSP0328-20130328/1048_1 /TAXON_ID=39455 /ORGANISM="Alexandrium minutum" /LENGTH=43 /assembly_acc=CAM_ASM_000350